MINLVNETDLYAEFREHFSHQCALLKENFEKRRINFHAINSKDEVAQFIIDFIQKRNIHKIAFSDSVSLHQCDVYNKLNDLNDLNLHSGCKCNDSTYEIINPFERTVDGKYKVFEDQPVGEKLNLPRDEYYRRMELVVEKMRQTLLSDVLIIGANAITFKGEIISIDGSGNRVAGMMFGPKHVIVVVGRNKLCLNVDEALSRIRNIAAPLNYIRHNMKHHNRYQDLPCVQRGKCFDCSHPRSACRKIAIMRGEVEFNADRTHVIFVNENLGL